MDNPEKDPARPDPDDLVTGADERDEQPQLGDVNSGGQPVDAAEQDPTVDDSTSS